MRPPNRTYVLPLLLVDELVRAGVRHACITPGSRSAPLAIALASHPSLRLWTHLDERAAAFFALGLAKASRTPVAIACTSGTAAANLLPAVVEAFHSRVALVVLTADRPPELRDCGAPQTIDQLRLFGAHVRWFAEPVLPEIAPPALHAARTLAARAVAAAQGPPAGPVHLNVPLREPLAPEPTLDDVAASAVAAGGRIGSEPWTRIQPACLPDPATLDAAAAILRRSRRPLVVCGPLDDPDPALPDTLAVLARRLGAPVLAEPASNLRRPALVPYLVDAGDALLRTSAFASAHAPDAVLRVGALPTSKAIVGWLAQHARVPQLALGAAGAWTDPDGVTTALLGGPPAQIFEHLAAAVDGAQPDPEWPRRWSRAGRAARAALRAALADPTAFFEGHVVAALATALPDHGLLYAGNSLAIRDLDWFWPMDAPPVRVLANRGANGIDGFVSSVLGATAIGAGPTVGLCGDLSFLHDLGGLLAAQRHGLRATFVVLDNDGGGIFDHLPVANYPEYHEALFVTPHGLDLGPLVRATGVAYVRAESIGAVETAVREALHAPGCTVVHVPLGRATSLAAHRRAWADAAAALEAA